MNAAAKKPNILIIVCDQLAWRALPCYGNTDVETPNIDRIASQAVRFCEVYTPCPLCMPARTSFWTSRLPHETGVKSNGGRYPSPLDIPADMPTLGGVLGGAGYRAVHFGKTHDSGALRGFEIAPSGTLPVESPAAWPASRDTLQDRHTTEACVRWLRETPASEQPWAVVCDLNNPHDICSWIGINQGEHVDTPLPEGFMLPELPANFEFDDINNRPLAVQYLCCSHNRQAQTSAWNRENFRYYLAAYYEYVRKADREIGLILDSLQARGEYDDTLIVFFADHGEGMASRRHVTKQVNFYEEIARVPMMFAGPGLTGNREISGPVSLLDLMPTLCDVAGADIPSECQGISLLPALTGQGELAAREYVTSEWTTEWGFTTSPGRMIRTRGFKYTKYVEDCRPVGQPVYMPSKPGSIDDGTGEELFDLDKDTLELKNVAKDPAYHEILLQHRELLRRQLVSTNDDFLNERSWAGRRWRSHPVGYANHQGHSAPELIMRNDDADLK